LFRQVWPICCDAQIIVDSVGGLRRIEVDAVQHVMRVHLAAEDKQGKDD
jgi:hypothetical protein